MRILLVDDHPAVQFGLRDLLISEFPLFRVEFASSEETALAALDQGHWDLAVLDINLPGRGGLELIAVLKERRPLLKVLIYTMHPENQFGLRAIRSQADGYLTKDASPQDVFTAVKQLQAGRKYLSPALAEQMALAVAGGVDVQKHERLSGREHEVLRFIADGKTLSEIAAELNVNIKTISTYRSRILEKLSVTTSADLIRYAIRHKLLDE